MSSRALTPRQPKPLDHKPDATDRRQERRARQPGGQARVDGTQLTRYICDLQMMKSNLLAIMQGFAPPESPTGARLTVPTAQRTVYLGTNADVDAEDENVRISASSKARDDIFKAVANGGTEAVTIEDAQEQAYGWSFPMR